jgi:hypothetical protein
MSMIFDTGALIAFDRGDRRVAALVEAVRRRRELLATSSGCVAQAWREGGPRQALLALLLSGIHERALDPTVSRRVGGLCSATRSTDVVDAHVVSLVHDDDIILTSDPDDLRKLLAGTGVRAEIKRC